MHLISSFDRLFTISFTVDQSLGTGSEYEYEVEIRAVMREIMDDESIVEVGTAAATLYRGSDAYWNNEEEDCYDQDGSDCDAAVFMRALIEDGEISEDVSEALDRSEGGCSFSNDLLTIRFVGVEPEFRGLGICRAAIVRMVQVFGGLSVVALQNCPMLYSHGKRSHYEPDEETQNLLPEDHNYTPSGVTESRARMWASLGFVEFADDIWISTSTHIARGGVKAEGLAAFAKRLVAERHR